MVLAFCVHGGTFDGRGLRAETGEGLTDTEPGPGATQGIGDQPIVEFHDRSKSHELHGGNAQLQVIEEELAHWEARVILRHALAARASATSWPKRSLTASCHVRNKFSWAATVRMPQGRSTQALADLCSQGWMETVIRFLLCHVIALPRLSMSVRIIASPHSSVERRCYWMVCLMNAWSIGSSAGRSPWPFADGIG